jgi:hypothetical protein
MDLLRGSAGQIGTTAGGLTSLATGPGGITSNAAGIEALSAELGGAPSAAEAASGAAMARMNQDAMTRAASARGANSALALRDQSMVNAGASRGAAQDAAAASVAEMNARYGQRAGMLDAAAGVKSQAGSALGAAGNLHGAAGNLYGAAGGQGITMRGQDVSREQGAANRSLQYRQNRADNSLGAQGITASSVNAANAAKAQVAQSNAANQQKMTGGIMSGIGAMFSDIRAKSDIAPLDMTGEALDNAESAARDQNEKLDRMVRSDIDGGVAGPGAPAQPPPWAKAAEAAYAPPPQPQGGGLDVGGALSAFGGALMSDEKSKERIAKLEAERDTLQESLDMLVPRQTVALPSQHFGGTTGTVQSEDMYRVGQTMAPMGTRPVTAGTIPLMVPTAGPVRQPREPIPENVDPRYAVDIGRAQVEPRPQYRVDIGPAQVEPVASRQTILSDKRSKEKIEALSNALDGVAGQGFSDRVTDMPHPTQPATRLLDMAANVTDNRDALGPMNGYVYRYKPEAAARMGTDTRPRPGIMAQEMDDSPAGRAVVGDTSAGKALDMNRAVGFSLAGLAGLDKRTRRLEAALGN